MSNELKIVTTGDFKPREADGYLYITIEGPSAESLQDVEAKKLALVACAQQHYENAGLTGTRTMKTIADGKGKYKHYAEFQCMKGIPSVIPQPASTLEAPKKAAPAKAKKSK